MGQDGVHRVRLSRTPAWCPSEGHGMEGAGDTVCRGKPVSVPQHAQAQAYCCTGHKARVEDNSIIDGSRECRTPPCAREPQAETGREVSKREVHL